MFFEIYKQTKQTDAENVESVLIAIAQYFSPSNLDIWRNYNMNAQTNLVGDSSYSCFVGILLSNRLNNSLFEISIAIIYKKICLKERIVQCAESRI